MLDLQAHDPTSSIYSVMANQGANLRVRDGAKLAIKKFRACGMLLEALEHSCWSHLLVLLAGPSQTAGMLAAGQLDSLPEPECKSNRFEIFSPSGMLSRKTKYIYKSSVWGRCHNTSPKSCQRLRDPSVTWASYSLTRNSVGAELETCQIYRSIYS